MKKLIKVNKTLKSFANKEIKNTKVIKGGTEIVVMRVRRYRGDRG